MNSNKFRFSILLGLLVFCLQANAQLSTREVPISFRYEFQDNFQREQQIPVITMPAVDIAKLQAEDEKATKLGRPFRFGYAHLVNINLMEAGHWQTLENGDRLLRLTIAAPDALSINLLYDKFWLPEGAKFFIYSNDRKHSIGAFTSANNQGSRNDIQGFATGLVPGSQITLEYFLPKDAKETGIISISDVVHGYRSVFLRYGTGFGFGQSGDCQVNINCSEGNNWQNEKRAVARIVIGTRFCTGFLINNVRNDFTPYFLTAGHCLYCDRCFIESQRSDFTPCSSTARRCLDCLRFSDVSQWVFNWNYELPHNPNDCNYKKSTPTEPNTSDFSTTGAHLLAYRYFTGDPREFALLRLREDPINLPDFAPYYLGWDRIGNRDIGGIIIHHPRGDVKKIATFNEIEHDMFIRMIQTSNGHSIVKHGSSGSPLINNNRHIIGIVVGIMVDGGCEQAEFEAAKDCKFTYAWTMGELYHWLDPTNTVTVLNGISAPCPVPVVYFNEPSVTDDYTIVGCADIDIEGVTISNGATLTLIAGSDINVQNVTVTNNSRLILYARGNVNLGVGFYVQLGSQFEMR